MAVDALAALTTRRDWILNYLSGLDATKPGGRPDAVGPGLNLKETEYRKSLYDELAMIDKAIADAEDPDIVESEYF